MSNSLTGGCLCGNVSYEAQAEPVIVGNCYCTDCRKASGTSHGTHVAIPDEALNLKGEIKFFDKRADSGSVVSRGFCPTCGTAIFSKNSGMPGMAFLRASSLDDPNQITPQMTVYASRAPEWAQIDASKPVYQEMMEDGPVADMRR